MAQWQELLKLDSALQDQVSQLYDRKFPREIRHFLSICIENQDWDSAAADINKANTCFRVLLASLEEQWNRCIQENHILQGPDFLGFRSHLQKNFEGEPLKMAAILCECLKEEKKILASASEMQGCSRPVVEQKWTKELDDKVDELRKQTLEVKKEIKSLEVLNENLDYIQKTWQSEVEQHVGLAKSSAFVEDECRKQLSFITQTKQMVLQQIMNILNMAKQIVETLTGVELPEWKQRLQMSCIGSPADTSLDHLQKWFSTVAEVLQQIHQELQKLQDQSKNYNITDASSLPGPAELEKFRLSLYKELLVNALVVEKQPIMASLPHRPLVLKTKVRFTVTVRFLANLPEFKCRLKVKPVFDKDVQEVKTIKGFRRFNFTVDNSKVLDVDAPEGGLVAEFGHMSLKEITVRTKGSAENRLGVTEELHVIKFVTEFNYAGLECNIEASSLPVVIISSTNQVPSAWASVMWCNMLLTSEATNLSLFLNPPPLTWQQLSQALSWQFLSVGKRELNEDQLSTLRDKIVDDPDDLVHWHKFSKNECVWIWIDAILDLIKRHLVDFWREGSIMGFVSREKARLLLKEKPMGTFLLRFSDSIKDGAITFSYVDYSNGESYVHAVEPYTKAELLFTALPDIINNYTLIDEGNMTKNPLLYLYPDIPKDTAFGHYYSPKNTDVPTPKNKYPYVRRNLSHMSDNPTPLPSPPQEKLVMDADTDMEEDTVKTAIEYMENHLFQELLSDSFCFPGSPFFNTSNDETHINSENSYPKETFH
ncbi:hypothetical protein PAMP_004151 [Pampus punctatissimus]